VLRIGSVGEDLVTNVAGIDDVLAQAKLLVDHCRQRLDPVGIDFAELLYPAEDIVELWHEALEFLLAHRDPRELGDVPDLFGRN